MNKTQKESLVRDFYQELQGYDIPDNLHLTFELASLLLGSKKMLDTERIFNIKEKVKKKIFSWLQERFKNDKNYYLEIKNNTLFLVRKKSLNLYREYTDCQTDSEWEKMYGILMGFPESATNAWFLDFDRNQNDRRFLMKFSEQQIIESVLGDIFLQAFVFSRENWMKEYRFNLKNHIYIYEIFPDIFLKDITEEEKVFYINIKSHLKKRNLLLEFSPLDKFILENIGSIKDVRKGVRIVGEFASIRKTAYDSLKTMKEKS